MSALALLPQALAEYYVITLRDIKAHVRLVVAQVVPGRMNSALHEILPGLTGARIPQYNHRPCFL